VARRRGDHRRQVGPDEFAAGARPERAAPTPFRGSTDGYPRNLDIIPLLDKAIESYKEMADHGGDLGINVTFENHWGLAADPMNIRIMLDTINHPYCEASPDFCNWEHEYMLFNGLKALAPYSHTNVHAKYWDRWGDRNDVQRSARIMLAGGFKGPSHWNTRPVPLNGIEGANSNLFKEVMAALSSPRTCNLGAVAASATQGDCMRLTVMLVLAIRRRRGWSERPESLEAG